MNPPNTHAARFVLFSDTTEEESFGRWHFELHSLDEANCITVSDSEPDVFGERLELLAVVRALESLDQSSDVTLVTRSSFVREGIRRGLGDWRKNDWCWECFGQMVPVKDCDLWRRIDRAMQFHKLDCRLYRNGRIAMEPEAVEMTSESIETVETQEAIEPVLTSEQVVMLDNSPCQMPKTGGQSPKRMGDLQRSRDWGRRGLLGRLVGFVAWHVRHLWQDTQYSHPAHR